MNQEQLYLESYKVHKDETCTIALVRTPIILVLLAYCVAWNVHNKKIRKSTVLSFLMEQPTQFWATSLSVQGSYVDEYQAYSSRVLQFLTLLGVSGGGAPTLLRTSQLPFVEARLA